jgi:outer membrane protein assembly factor BamA
MKMRRLLMLLWLPAMACAAYAQQSFYGTTVSGVSLSADADPADQARIPIKAGDVITPENVRASIQALFDSGQYRSVEVDATATSNGTQLTFNVVRHLFFSTFELVPETLLDRAISTLIRLPVGQRYSDERVDEIVKQTKQVLEDAGLFQRARHAVRDGRHRSPSAKSLSAGYRRRESSRGASRNEGRDGSIS